MKKVVIIGDVHGKIDKYKKLISRFTEPTICLGDVGIGFRTQSGFPVTLGEMDIKDRFFAGNHDNPQECKNEEGYLGRYGMTSEGIFFVSGAFSVDAFYRTYGIDWWSDEQLSNEEMEDAKRMYIEAKPDIVVTHDCPRSVLPVIMAHCGKVNYPVYENTTSWFLEELLNIHQPKIHIFGHYHRAMDKTIGNTRFVCVPELGTFTLEL